MSESKKERAGREGAMTSKPRDVREVILFVGLEVVGQFSSLFSFLFNLFPIGPRGESWVSYSTRDICTGVSLTHN